MRFSWRLHAFPEGQQQSALGLQELQKISQTSHCSCHLHHSEAMLGMLHVLLHAQHCDQAELSPSTPRT